MNTIEWSTKAVRQLRKIADQRKRQGIFAAVQQLAHWPIARVTSNACKDAMATGYASMTIG